MDGHVNGQPKHLCLILPMWFLARAKERGLAAACPPMVYAREPSSVAAVESPMTKRGAYLRTPFPSCQHLRGEIVTDSGTTIIGNWILRYDMTFQVMKRPFRKNTMTR